MRIVLLIASCAILQAQQQDLAIVRKADEILASEAVWNRQDTRQCPTGARTFSLYCALEKAIVDSGYEFAHRATVMEQVRVVVELAAPNAYEHRLMGYNNDLTVTFADLKRMLRLAELRIAGGESKGTSAVRGRLVQNGSPVPDATVALYCRDPKIPKRNELTTVTANDGSFQFNGLLGLEGWYVYGKMESIGGRGATTPAVALTLPGETTIVRDLDILPGHSMRGKIVLSDGRPIGEGSRVTVESGCVTGCPPFDVPDSQEAALPPNGAFAFRGLRGPIRLWMSVKGYGLHVDEPNGKPPGSDNYNERVRQMLNVVERVVDRDADDIRIVLEPRMAAPRR